MNPISTHRITSTEAVQCIQIWVTAASLELPQGPNLGIDAITNPVFAGITIITIASIKLYALPRSASHFQGSPNTGPFCGAVAPRPLWRLAPVIGPSPAKRETSGVSKSHRTHRILMARSLVVWPPQLRSNTGSWFCLCPSIRAVDAAKQIGIQEASDWLMEAVC